MQEEMMAQFAPVLLIGSIPMKDAAEVFTCLGKELGGLASRYPDGETGERINWVRWQRHVFDSNSDLELITSKKLAGFNDTLDRPFYRLKPDVDLKEFKFKRLGYAEKAKESYREFRRLKDHGQIPAGVRFQVCMPTAVSLMSVFVDLDDRLAVEPTLELAFKREVEELAADIPHDELAIQWDVCHELVGHDGGIQLHVKDILEEASRRCAKLVDFAPADIEVGLHLCYGDPGHKHIVEPKDLGTSVAFCNRTTQLAHRNVDYVHIPVPRGFKSATQYAPLANLDVPASTAVYLGLVHFTDGMDGTKERISLAKRYLKQFGVATECGFGRRDPGTTGSLLDLHRQAAAALN
jgi:hypothetical protein